MDVAPWADHWIKMVLDGRGPKTPSALLTGNFLRVRKIFARIVYNVSLKGQILSRQCKSDPDSMDGFKLFM